MFIIRPLRLSNFRVHLEMLEEEDAGDGAACHAPRASLGGVWHSSDSVQYAFDNLDGGGAYVPADQLSALYGEMPPADRESQPSAAKDKPRPERPEVRFERVLRRLPCDRASIAAELHLHPGLTRADLTRIRRNFALRNHPDRVPPYLRDEANQRMTIANALIDGELKARAAAGRT